MVIQEPGLIGHAARSASFSLVLLTFLDRHLVADSLEVFQVYFTARQNIRRVCFREELQKKMYLWPITGVRFSFSPLALIPSLDMPSGRDSVVEAFSG